MDSRSFLKKTATYGLGTVLLQASGFILLPIYTRALSPADFGALEIVNRLGEVLTICLLVNGIRQAVLAFYNQGRDAEERRYVVGTAMALLGATGAAGFIATVCVARFLSPLLGLATPALLELAILATMLEVLTLTPLALAQARVEAVAFVTATLSQVLVKVSLAILFVVVFHQGIWGVLIASVMTSGIFAVVLTARECVRTRPRLNAAMARDMFRFAWPFLLAGICGFLLNFGDRFFLLRYSDPNALGFYAIGYRIAMIVGLISRAPVQMVWNAQMYEAAERADAPAVFGRMFTRILGAYLFVGLGVCLLQDEVIVILCGSPYAAAAAIVAPVVLAYFFLAAADLMDAGLFVRRRTSRKAAVALASAAATTGFYALLIPSQGAMGAAIATLGGFIVHAALTYTMTRAVFTVNYETKRIAAMLCSAVVLWSVSRWLTPGWLAVSARITLWACWAAVLWIGGVITPAEKQWVQETVRSIVERHRPATVCSTAENAR